MYILIQKIKIVDKHDFLNEVNKEKKSFERLLDDCVAKGMDQGIQVTSWHEFDDFDRTLYVHSNAHTNTA
jgi:hypothetical protein